MCGSTSSFSSVASLAPPLSELFMNLRKIENGGAATSKPNTRRHKNQANSVFRPFLPIDVSAKTNQLLNQLEN
ncbi:hypothetical protein AVEN_175536-1 [Araneus ventricosus]|uniref:Uncharacterized protein n=1 Tax=Araneus ventricosus TaxID=182803 RepID=A0A4Y2CP51_ARAVE|nr:hypothetical protein AVEN_175536-1 [Araneus ventricosus]